MKKRGRNIKWALFIITTTFTLSMMVGCSDISSLEDTTIISENVSEEVAKEDLKVVSKEEYSFSSEITNETSRIIYSNEENYFYLEYDEGFEHFREKLSFEEGKVIRGQQEKLVEKSEISEDIRDKYSFLESVDGYTLGGKMWDNWIEDSKGRIERVYWRNLANNKDGEFQVPKGFNYFYTIGIVNDKLFYASGKTSNQQFPNRIGTVDLSKGKIEEPIDLESGFYSATILDEDNVIIAYLSEIKTKLSIFNIQNKTNDNFSIYEEGYNTGISKNKDKFYYTEWKDEKYTINVITLKNGKIVSKCKVYDSDKIDLFPVAFNVNGDELIVSSISNGQKVIKYKFNM